MNNALRLWRVAGAIVTASCLGACAQIEVRVDVADPDSVLAQIHAARSRSVCQEMLEDDTLDRIDKKLGQDQDEITTKVSQLQDKAIAYRNTLTPTSQLDLDAAFAGSIARAELQPSRDSARRDMWESVQNLQAKARTAKAGGTALCTTAAFAGDIEVHAYQRSHRGWKDFLNGRLKELKVAIQHLQLQAKSGQADASNAQKEVIVGQVQVSATQAAQGIVGDNSIANSEYAFAVINTPDNQWKTDFNRAYASAYMGSSDMVLRMNSTADFSVKGLSFDPSQVAQVASKLATQTLVVGARVAGLGLPGASAPSGGDSGAASTSGASSIDAQLASSDAVVKARQASLTTMRWAVLSLARSAQAAAVQSEAKDVSAKPASDPKRQAINASMFSAVGALESLLNLSAMQ
jgi:hypothetical protein